MLGAATDHFLELDERDRTRIFNLGYYTWVEQQGKTVEELNRLWDPDFWTEMFGEVQEWDRLIVEFNDRTGVLAGLD